jgi:peptide/nickel transport system ATP-binding protein
MTEAADDILLDVQHLKVHFQLPRRNLFAKPSKVHATDDVSFQVKRGTTLGIVGESGSGKTTTALAVMRLVPITAGAMRLGDTDLVALEGEALRQARSRMQIIFQDPYSSLNPRVRAGAIVREPMDLMNIGSPGDRDGQVAELFKRVGLRPEQQALFPHQFSGGQRQRIGVARALATRPELVVCDEPVSALDVAIQAQILNLLRQLQAKFGLTYLFISHDLGVVQYMCDEIAVMYLGQIVEQADRMSLFTEPLHPYTWALLSAVPSADPTLRDRTDRIRLQGDPPSPIDPPPGCRFASRCPFSQELCTRETPPLRPITDSHAVACHFVSDDGVPPQRARRANKFL